MIGEPVDKAELEKLLAEEEEKDVLRKKLNDEWKKMKPGECLVYAVEVGEEKAAAVVPALSMVEGLRVIERSGKVYVYKEP